MPTNDSTSYVSFLDSSIAIAEAGVKNSQALFYELSDCIKAAMQISDNEEAVADILKLKNRARDSYQTAGSILGELKRYRARLASKQ